MILPLGKLLLGASLVGAVPAVALTSPSFFSSLFPSKTTAKEAKSSLPEWLQKLNDKCYVIPTDNNEQTKLLVCANPDRLGLNNDLYFLYGHENQKINKKVLEVTKDVGSKQIRVKLQGAGETLSSEGKEVTMEITGKDWEGITETDNLSDNCFFTSYSDRAELSCHFDTEQKKIPLTKFVVEK